MSEERGGGQVGGKAMRQEKDRSVERGRERERETVSEGAEQRGGERDDLSIAFAQSNNMAHCHNNTG